MNDALRVAGSDIFSQGTVLRVEIEGAEPILLKPKRETVFGRRDPATGTMPDVDLTPFAGYRMGVSRRHIVIRQSEDNRLDVLDLGSSNGTFVNGQKLTPNQPQRLRDGDELRLGQMVMKIFFQKPLVEESSTQPKPATAEASPVPMSAQVTGVPPVVTQPPAAKPAQATGEPPVITQPDQAKPAQPTTGAPPVVTPPAPPAEIKPSQPATGAPPIITQPGEAKPVVPPAPAPAAGSPSPAKPGEEENPPGTGKLSPPPDENQPETGSLPPLPEAPASPNAQSDPGGTRILHDPDAKS